MNKIKLNATLVNEVIFLFLIAVLGYLFVMLFTPFLPVIFISIIIVIFYHPIYKFLVRVLRNRVLSSLITSVFVVISLLLPISLIFAVAAQQVDDVTEKVITTVTDDILVEQKSKDEVKRLINEALVKLGIDAKADPANAEVKIDFSNILSNSNVLRSLVDLVPIVISTIAAFADLIFKLFILLFVTIFLFVEYENLAKYLMRYSPLENGLDELLFEKFVQTIKTIIKGSFFVALIQATVIILPMVFFGIPGTAIWWIIMFILSIVPVGAGAISIPIGLFMIVSPEYSPLQGIFLIVYSIISINLIDSLVRPQLTKDGTGLHPIMILLSGIGGIIIFSSPLGLIYGQLIAVFYKTVIQVYQEKYNSDQIALEKNESKKSD